MKSSVKTDQASNGPVIPPVQGAVDLMLIDLPNEMRVAREEDNYDWKFTDDELSSDYFAPVEYDYNVTIEETRHANALLRAIRREDIVKEALNENLPHLTPRSQLEARMLAEDEYQRLNQTIWDTEKLPPSKRNLDRLRRLEFSREAIVVYLFLAFSVQIPGAYGLGPAEEYANACSTLIWTITAALVLWKFGSAVCRAMDNIVNALCALLAVVAVSVQGVSNGIGALLTTVNNLMPGVVAEITTTCQWWRVTMAIQTGLKVLGTVGSLLKIPANLFFWFIGGKKGAVFEMKQGVSFQKANRYGVLLSAVLAAVMFVMIPIYGFAKSYKLFEPVRKCLENLPPVLWLLDWLQDPSVDTLPKRVNEFREDLVTTRNSFSGDPCGICKSHAIPCMCESSAGSMDSEEEEKQGKDTAPLERLRERAREKGWKAEAITPQEIHALSVEEMVDNKKNLSTLLKRSREWKMDVLKERAKEVLPSSFVSAGTLDVNQRPPGISYPQDEVNTLVVEAFQTLCKVSPKGKEKVDAPVDPFAEMRRLNPVVDTQASSEEVAEVLEKMHVAADELIAEHKQQFTYNETFVTMWTRLIVAGMTHKVLEFKDKVSEKVKPVYDHVVVNRGWYALGAATLCTGLLLAMKAGLPDDESETPEGKNKTRVRWQPLKPSRRGGKRNRGFDHVISEVEHEIDDSVDDWRVERDRNYVRGKTESAVKEKIEKLSMKWFPQVDPDQPTKGANADIKRRMVVRRAKQRVYSHTPQEEAEFLKLASQKKFELPESMLNKHKLLWKQYAACVFKVFQDGKFTSSSTVCGNKVIVPLHSDQDSSDVRIQNHVTNAQLRGAVIPIAEDLGVYTHHGEVKATVQKMRPPRNELVLMMGFNSADQEEPAFSVGMASSSGLYDAATAPGDCAGPVIACEDGAIVGWHISGSAKVNRFVPVTEDIVKRIKSPGSTLMSMLFA